MLLQAAVNTHAFILAHPQWTLSFMRKMYNCSRLNVGVRVCWEPRRRLESLGIDFGCALYLCHHPMYNLQLSVTVSSMQHTVNTLVNLTMTISESHWFAMIPQSTSAGSSSLFPQWLLITSWCVVRPGTSHPLVFRPRNTGPTECQTDQIPTLRFCMQTDKS